MKWYSLGGLGPLLAGLLLFSACAPVATPANPPDPAPSTVAPPRTAPTATTTAEESAWQKTVDAAKREGSVTIYSFNLGGDVGLAVSKAFKEKYGISLEIITGRGAEQLERLKAERRMGRMVGDVMDGSRVHNTNVKKEGLSVSFSELPVFKDKQAWALDPFVLDETGHVLAFSFFLYSPFINPRVVKPGEEPKSYKDMLDPRWKGKMMIPDPNISGGAYEAFVPFLNARILDTDFLRALGRQDLVFTRGDNDSIERLARGEYPLSIRTAAVVSANYALEGAPIKAIPMAEGHVGSALAMVPIKDAPHPNATKVYVNWLLSQEGQTVFGKAKAASSMRKDVPDFMPEAVQVKGAKIVMPTEKDTDDAANMFRDKFFINLWKK